jgi:hypothetical protein
LTAARLIGEIAGADRFATDAKLARTGGAAPIVASSGNTTRHRLDRGGNRQLNCALHRLAVNKANWDADTAADLERKRAERKSREEALRCLKRHLARRAWRLLRSAPTPNATPVAHDSGSSAFSSRRSGRCRRGRGVSPCAYGRASSDAITSSRCVDGAERMSVTTGAFWMWG